MLLNALQCAGQPPQCYLAQFVNMLRLRNTDLEPGLIFKQGCVVVTLAFVWSID